MLIVVLYLSVFICHLVFTPQCMGVGWPPRPLFVAGSQFLLTP